MTDCITAEAGHTATPWIANELSQRIHTADDVTIARCEPHSTDMAKANAAHIVRCVNSHDELAQELASAAVALEEAAKLLFAKGFQGTASIMAAHASKARAAVSRAQGTAS